jgi:quercetin dioxygenase-like cupin family protein
MSTRNLDTIADDQLRTARAHASGRSAVTLVHDGGLRQTVIALRAGGALSEHTANGEATLIVLRGTVRLVYGEVAVELGPGDVVSIPHTSHSVEADEDAVVVLTVAMGEPPPFENT